MTPPGRHRARTLLGEVARGIGVAALAVLTLGLIFLEALFLFGAPLIAAGLYLLTVGRG